MTGAATAASDRPVVVTGASSGIGAAVARRMAAAGHPVVLGARRLDRLAALAEEIAADGGTAHVHHLDLCDPPAIASFAEAAIGSVGTIDVIVSNAGDVQPLEAAGDPSAFARQLAVNLTGPQALLHHLVPAMVSQGHGDVVLVTSEVAAFHRPHVAGYVAAKAGLEALGRAMQMELEGTGVRIGMVRPGPVATEQGSTWSAEAIERVVPSWERRGLMRHAGLLRADDVAAAVTTIVAAPRGGQIALLEVQPTAPANGAEDHQEGP